MVYVFDFTINLGFIIINIIIETIRGTFTPKKK